MFRALCIYLMVFCTGCASMFKGTSQNILLNSEVKGAKLYLNNEQIGTNSATVQISKKDLKNSVLMAKKQGCTDYQTRINTKFDPTSLLGILIDFGIVTILVIDWAITGAVNEAERTDYLLNPICEG